MHVEILHSSQFKFLPLLYHVCVLWAQPLQCLKSLHNIVVHLYIFARIIQSSKVKHIPVPYAPVFIQKGMRERTCLLAFGGQNCIICRFDRFSKTRYLVFVACPRDLVSHCISKTSLKHSMCFQVPRVECLWLKSTGGGAMSVVLVALRFVGKNPTHVESPKYDPRSDSMLFMSGSLLWRQCLDTLLFRSVLDGQ